MMLPKSELGKNEQNQLSETGEAASSTPLILLPDRSLTLGPIKPLNIPISHCRESNRSISFYFNLQLFNNK